MHWRVPSQFPKAADDIPSAESVRLMAFRMAAARGGVSFAEADPTAQRAPTITKRVTVTTRRVLD
jgi:hypothetical protein